MPKERNALKAGLFIVISVVLAFGLIIGIRGISGFMAESQLRTVCFSLQDDLSGLRVGDDVRIGGFKVGDVRAIEIVPATDPRLKKLPPAAPAAKEQAAILVTFAMPKQYSLRQGAHIGVQSTITEKTCLNINKLGQGDALALDAPLIGTPGAMSALIASLADAGPKVTDILTQARSAVTNVNDGITEIRPRISGILDDVRKQTIPTANRTLDSYTQVADSAKSLVQEIRGQLKPIIDKYNSVADSATRMMDTVGGLFGDTKPDFRATIKNLAEATGTIRKDLPEISAKAKTILDNANSAIVSAKSAIEDLKKTLENTRDLTGSAKAVVVGNKGRFDTMIRALEGTAKNLEIASVEVRSRPWRLLYTPKKSEVENLALFDTAREFAKGASEMNDAAQALRDALAEKTADPEKLKKLRTDLDKSFEGFQTIESKLLQKMQE